MPLSQDAPGAAFPFILLVTRREAWSGPGVPRAWPPLPSFLSGSLAPAPEKPGAFVSSPAWCEAEEGSGGVVLAGARFLCRRRRCRDSAREQLGRGATGCRALNSPRGERRLVGARRAPAGLAFSVPCGQGPGSLSQKRRRRLQGTSGHVGTDRAQCPWWPMPGQHSPWYPRAQNKNLECGPPTPRGLAPDPQAWGPVASGCGSASPSLGAGLRCPVG